MSQPNFQTEYQKLTTKDDNVTTTPAGSACYKSSLNCTFN